MSFLQEWITEHLVQNSEDPIKMMLPGPHPSCLDEADGSVASESASSTSSQGDSVLQGLECQPATADGVGQGMPLSLAAMPTFSLSQHPLLSGREPLLHCLLSPAVSGSFWRLVEAGYGQAQDHSQGRWSAAGLPEMLRGYQHALLSMRFCLAVSTSLSDILASGFFLVL